MKKLLYGILSLVMALGLWSCSDDDFVSPTEPLLREGAVVTGSADVTAIGAVMHGTVAGLESQDASAYAAGFYYGKTQDDLSERVLGGSAAEFSANLSGLPGEVYYYQAFVTLQGRVTVKGEVKSLVLTDAKAITGEATDITANRATFAGQITDYPANIEAGIVVSGVEGIERVRAGVRIPGASESTFSVKAEGLLPATTYYYAAYLDLGAGVVYGETKQFTTPAQEFTTDDFVDLGLSTKWAKTNLGASAENEDGALLGFGDLTGYNTSIDPAMYASADIYRTAQDVANKVTGGLATIPTIAEYEELFRLCQVEWTAENGVEGYRFTGPNGNSIFMPAAGSRTQAQASGAGTEGRYLSGSVNASDQQFAMSYLFNATGNGRATTPVYQALSVRPVSVAKNIAFDKQLLFKTWEIDLDADGNYKTFHGPTYFYGTQDSWRTVTNGEPVVGDSWCWDADFAGNSWAVGGDAKNCQGSITFREDGTVTVVHKTADGQESTEDGTYTIDEQKKEITLKGCKVLAPANFTTGYVDNLTDNIKILSLTDKSLQLGVFRNSDPATLSINMIPQLEKYGYTAKLTCYGQNGDHDAEDGWDSATLTIPGGATGTFTITFNAREPRTNGKVYVLDIPEFATAYPNAFIRIDKIEADGNDVPFDQNKFYFGNIEGAGTYRVEMANIWGCGHNDSWDGLGDTPFHPEGGPTTNETALGFQQTFAVTFTIVSLDANLSFNAKQSAVALTSPWAMPGNWGKENPGAVQFALDPETHSYKYVGPEEVELSLTADECGGAVPNGAVNLVDIVGIGQFFPAFTADLLSVTNDGINVPFDATKLKVGDIEGNGNYRIELHNIWGAGTAADPAFGGAEVVEGNNIVNALGFNSTSVYKIGHFSKQLFKKPW